MYFIMHFIFEITTNMQTQLIMQHEFNMMSDVSVAGALKQEVAIKTMQ